MVVVNEGAGVSLLFFFITELIPPCNVFLEPVGSALSSNKGGRRRRGGGMMKNARAPSWLDLNTFPRRPPAPLFPQKN